MHITTQWASKEFSFLVDGEKSSFDHIFPNFNVNDRIGIVVNETGGSMGAAALFMAAVTRFYDFYRERFENNPGELWIYPDFFVFHVGQYHMNHYYMEVWPSHKEVLVEDEPEQILQAINDRGITRLIVEDKDPVEGFILKETLCSAQERIVTTLAYSPSGRTKDSNIEVTSCQKVENNIDAAIDWANEVNEISNDVQMELKNRRKSLIVNDNVVETFRKIELDDALKMLTKNNVKSELTKKYISLSSCND